MASFVCSCYAMKISLGEINSSNILHVQMCVCMYACEIIRKAIRYIFTDLKPADLIRTISVSIMYDSLVNSEEPIRLRRSSHLIGF